MTEVPDRYVEAGVKAFRKAERSTWEIARIAYAVHGPIGEDGVNHGGRARLEEWRERIAQASLTGEAAALDSDDDLPSVKTLRGYVEACEAVPDRDWESHITVRAARALYVAAPA